jgi:Flp pilus assembly protein TadD
MKPRRQGLQILIQLCVIVFSSRVMAFSSDTGPYSVRSKVIVAEPHFQNPFDVILFRDDGVEEVARVRATPTIDFRFPRLAAGTYVLTVNIPGYKEVRERIRVGGPQPEASTTIFMEPRVTPEPERPNLDSVRDYDDENLIAASDLGKYPQRLTDELDAAQEELRRKNFEGALRRLNDVLQRFPKYYPAMRDRGVVYQKLGRYAEARSDYKKAQGLMSSSPVPLIYRAGLSLLEARATPTGKMQRSLIVEAQNDLLKAIRIWPHSCFAHYLLGVTYYEAEVYEDAEDSLLHALDLDPGFSEPHLALGNVYIKLQEWDRALLHVNTYLAGSENSEDLHSLQTIRSRLENIIDNQVIPFESGATELR